jgi:hypothetical protein
MLYYPCLQEQDEDILESLKRADQDKNDMRGEFDKLKPFSNGQDDHDPQWQDFMRIIIRYVANGNGSITYGAIIKVLRGTAMYSAAVQLELQSVWDSESMYSDDTMPWHLQRCDIGNLDKSHKIICAICIFLCEKYHRFETLASVMGKLGSITLKTSDWSGLLDMFNEQLAIYRRLGNIDRAACKLAPYVINGINKCVGSETSRMVMSQHFETILYSQTTSWSTNYPGRIPTELELLQVTVDHIFNAYRQRQALGITPKQDSASHKGTKLGVKAIKMQQSYDSDQDPEWDQADIIDSIDFSAMSVSDLEQFKIKAAYGNFKPSGGGGKPRDKDRQKPMADPEMDGRCFSCGTKTTDHVSDTCPWVDPKKLNKKGRPLLDFAKICLCTPAATKKKLLEDVFEYGKLKWGKDPVRRTALRTKLEAAVWVADKPVVKAA